VCTLTAHTNVVTSLAVGSLSDLFVSGSADNSIKMWSLQTGKCIHNAVIHTDSISSVQLIGTSDSVFNSGSSEHVFYLVSASRDGKIKLWKWKNM